MATSVICRPACQPEAFPLELHFLFDGARAEQFAHPSQVALGEGEHRAQQINGGNQQKDNEPREPHRLRDRERRAERRDRMRVGLDRLFEHLPGIEGNEREEVDERRESDHVEQCTDARRQMRVDGIDAHVHAMHKCDGAAP